MKMMEHNGTCIENVWKMYDTMMENYGNVYEICIVVHRSS